MTKFLAAALLPLGAALALASPAQADTAANTINGLQAQGYNVTISRVGNGPLNECTVIGVRTSRAPSQFTLIDDDDLNVFTTAAKPKATVSLNCAN